jgi:hypothetical protein
MAVGEAIYCTAGAPKPLKTKTLPERRAGGQLDGATAHFANILLS